ncbi:MAG TPA: hypothetical protein PLF13_06860 [candidate division Zixibacteria bacterium]|nr:hypothetical protein [candidate division Zixibacteria bacterium]
MTEATVGKKLPLAAVLFNLLLAFSTFLICTVMSELAVRWLFGDSMYLFPRFQTAAHYGPVSIPRLRSNETFRHKSADGSWEFTTNNWGFRDYRDYDYEKADSVYRILCLGDSQTMGYECDQDSTWPAVLERELRVRSVRFEVLNCGIAGFGTAQELAFLHYEGLRYQPDLVVLGFYANDFEDAEHSGLYAIEHDSLVLSKTTYLPGIAVQDRLLGIGLFRWLIQHSFLFSMMVNVITSETDQEAVEARAVVDNGPTSSQERLAEALILRMKMLCDSSDTRFIVLDLPHPLEKLTGPSMPTALIDSLSAHDVRVLEASYIVNEELPPGAMNRPHGLRHLTPATQEVIGRRLAEQLTNP